MSPLVEDFSEAAAFVQEDTSYVEQGASDDEVDRKIAEEHAKYKEALARRQEEVRASRPWSAPPVESPRPEQQKEREKERQARGSIGDVDLDAPRAEYEPPARPYLLQAQASGNNLSYLSRPQSAEHRTATAARSLNGHPSRVSLSGIEEETGEGTACDSRQASEMGRLNSTFGEGMSTSGGPADDVPGRDQGGARKDDGDDQGTAGREEDAERELPPQPRPLEHLREEDDDGADEEERDGGGGDGGGGVVAEETDPRVREPSAEEVAEDSSSSSSRSSNGGARGDEESGDEEEGDRRGSGGHASRSANGDGDAEAVDDGVLLASGEGLVVSSLGVDQFYGRNPQQLLEQIRSSSHDGDGEGGEASQGAEHGQWGNEEEEQQQRVRGSVGGEDGEEDDARSAAQGAPSVAAASTPRSMAMRGFVEPLPYEASYGVGGQRSATPPPATAADDDYDVSAERRDAMEAEEAGGGEDGEGDGDGNEAEEEDYDEDTFEDDETEERGGVDSSERHLSASGEGSLLRASPSASKALLSTSLRSRRGSSSVLAPLSKEPSRVFSSAASPAAAVAPPLLPHASRSTVGGDEDGDDGLTVPPPPSTSAAAAPSALPPIFKTTDGDAHSQRSLSSGGGGATSAASSTLPPPTAPSPLAELQPSQQFALQLLKHDIEVLPQHHRAAAEAAAAARRRSSTARPAGAGLAAFGYLGYHMVSEELTAPSGPAFRSGSPGRASISPGRGDGGAALLGSTSLKAVRSVDAAAAARGSGGRPTSAPHMRPSGSTSVGEGGAGTGGGAGDTVAAVAGGPPGGFVSVTRDMRAAGRLLPPVVPPTAPRVGRSNSGNGARPGGGDAEGGGGGVGRDETSVSVMGESEINVAVAQNRIKFDVWLDALSSGGAAAPPPGTNSGAAAAAGADGAAVAAAAATGGGRRPPRPMTAPASGRRRPVSARPGGGGTAGMYTAQPAVVNIPKPLMRPMSAQPHHLRPASARNGSGGGAASAAAAGGGVISGAGGAAGAPSGLFDGLSLEPPIPMTFQPLDAPPAAGGTAAVEVGGVTVSVYVADTLKRIVEANRWLQQLGVCTKRYRLKDRFSNMTIQLVEELPPLQSELAAAGGMMPYDGGAVAIVKELTLKQFLSGHAKLKQQAKKVRQATALAAAAQQVVQSGMLPPAGLSAAVAVGGGSSMYGVPEYGPGGGGAGRASNGRPFSATFGRDGGGIVVGSGGNGAGPNGSRGRPASAMPYSGGNRTITSSTGGVDPFIYGGSPGAGGAVAAPGQPGYPTGRPVRPSSANPAYGRTPTFNLGSSPPGVPGSPFLHTAYAAHATGAAAGGPSASAKSPGGGGAVATTSVPRTAWGAAPGGGGGGYASYQGYPGGAAAGGRGSSGGGGGLPYMHRSISATGRTHGSVGLMDDDNDSERPMVIEPDERGDVSRAVRQQLGSAADYCQSRRQEISRLRTLPLA